VSLRVIMLRLGWRLRVAKSSKGRCCSSMGSQWSTCVLWIEPVSRFETVLVIYRYESQHSEEEKRSVHRRLCTLLVGCSQPILLRAYRPLEGRCVAGRPASSRHHDITYFSKCFQLLSGCQRTGSTFIRPRGCPRALPCSSHADRTPAKRLGRESEVRARHKLGPARRLVARQLQRSLQLLQRRSTPPPYPNGKR
jgi:hypothetical protein